MRINIHKLQPVVGSQCGSFAEFGETRIHFGHHYSSSSTWGALAVNQMVSFECMLSSSSMQGNQSRSGEQ